MRKHIVLLFSALFILNFSSANPIMPESLIAEVYFEDDEWFFVIDNMLLEIYGIEDFNNIQIVCNNGPLLFDPGFLPDFSNQYTILSNENLLNPIEIERSGDSIVSFWEDSYYGNYEFTTLVWNDVLPSPVCGPFVGQALSVIMIPVSMEEYEWWLVKNNSPYINGGGYNVYGDFQGYVFDQNQIPIPEAEIEYVDSYYIECPYNCFDPLITDNTGYFEISLPARNYFISHVIKNNQTYDINEYVSIEPDISNIFDITIDYIVGQNAIEVANKFDIQNYPNPFAESTVFIISCNDKTPLNNAHIQISTINGKLVSILPVNRRPDNNGQIKIEWQNSSSLNSGQYLYTLYQGHEQMATGKMMITK